MIRRSHLVRWSVRVARVLGPGVGTALILLGGCAGHGRYTTEQITAARVKMDAMKSATEWEAANTAFLSGNLEKALKEIDHSIAHNDAVAKSHTLRGRILIEMSRVDEGVASLRRALELDGKYVDAAFYLGVAYERLAQLDAALEQYQHAAALDPADPHYVIAAAEVLVDLGRTEEARALLLGAPTDLQSHAGIKQSLGHVAMVQGDAPAAAAYLADARLIAPNDDIIAEDFARAQAAAKQFSGAETTLTALLAKDSLKDRRDLRFLRARCLIELDRGLEARDILVKLTAEPAGTNDVESWIELGQLSLLLKDDIRARRCAGRIISIAPDRPEGYVIRGVVRHRSGDSAGACTDLTRAVDLGGDANALVMAGIVHAAQRQRDDARRCFEAALAKDPNRRDARELLASVNAPE